MTLQDALIRGGLAEKDEQLISRLQREFNRAYDQYIGDGHYCPEKYWPDPVKSAWQALQDAKHVS